MKPGQVLWLKFRFNNSGDISTIEHPYLILKIDTDLNIVEIGQLDSIHGKKKIYKSMLSCNKVILKDNPDETVISQDSYLQKDNLFQIEYYTGLSKYLRTEDCLSSAKFDDVLESYEEYHKDHYIDEDKQVYLSMQELEALQTT